MFLDKTRGCAGKWCSTAYEQDAVKAKNSVQQ